MAKKSQRRPVRHERDQSGCMWGLISMFDFRQGRSTQRLLSDRRRGTRHVVASGNSGDKADMLVNLAENCQGTPGGEEITIASDASKPSVKKLMEEEMFCEKDINKEVISAEVDPKESNSECGGHKRKNRKKTSRNRTKSCEIYIEDLDAAEKLEPENSCIQNSEKQSTNDIDMDDMLEEFCHQIHRLSCIRHEQSDEVHNQPNQKNPDVEEKLGEAIKLFISQRLINGKHVNGDGDIHPPKEFNDALKLLSSDEELFRNLLQRQKSVMVKYVENLWNAHIEKEKISKQSNFSEHETHDVKQSDEVVHSKQRKFFRRKTKSVEKNPLMEPKAAEGSNRIVILKPGPITLEKPETERSLRSSPDSQTIVRNTGPNERVSPYFFLTEIKRKLKQAMGKEQQEISPEGISKRFPNERKARRDSDKKYKENVGRSSPSKEHFFIEKIARPPVGVKKGDKLKECEISMEHKTGNYPRHRLSNIYIEAKKHLSEMLTGGTGDADFSSRQVPKTLGRILSLPEYNFSPIGSPGRDWGQNFVSSQMRLSTDNKFEKQENNVSHLGRMALNAEAELCVSEDTADNKKEASPKPNSNPSNELVKNDVEKFLCSTGVRTSEGDLDIVKEANIVLQEDSNMLDTLSESSSSSTIREDKNVDISEVCDAKRHSECSTHDLDEENQLPYSPITSPSSNSITKKDRYLESVVVVEVLERPSPISVLEPLFTEEDVSPASTRSQPAELPMLPQRIQFEENDPLAEDIVTHLKGIQEKESLFEYVKAVLHASELNWDEFYIMSNSSDPLLDPSIFDEVGLFPNQLCCDKKLLFDCINEALMEVYGRYFGCPLGLSFEKPHIRPAPDLRNAIHEVWEGVYWYLLPLPLPHTLEQIVRKDMAKTGTWMDFRNDSETMIIEISEAIVKDLMEETMVSCVNEISETGIPSFPAELKDESCIDL
ncbi:uncharacterized protein LOC105642980 isoform X2 [Jatropha curcas]|uniref:uncharacterized protein LOC105642980 isoform X2 n=1 Tax=Jatropha curcas TaxID=180498 RepID=UPI0005FB3DCD|nr:uncharacterized protein LOC105642980 isoform X2 [Jatropha curcas]